MTGPLAYRCGAALMLGLSLFGVGAYLELLALERFHPILLPLGLAAGAAIAFRRGLPEALAPEAIQREAPVPAGWLYASAILIGAIVVAVAVGSLATPSRSWDGVVAWELKAHYLSLDPSIAQPFFEAPDAYSHCLDYPLVQPAAIAAINLLTGSTYLGRIFFAVILTGLLALVGAAVRAGTGSRRSGVIACAAVAVTPALVNPAMGAADSGFADLLLAFCLTGVVTAITTRDTLLLAAATALAVMSKPEGIAYAALVAIVLWIRAERHLLRGCALGFAVGAAAWFPVQQQLLHRGTEPPAPWLAWTVSAAAAAVLLGSDRALTRLGTRGRLLLSLVLAPVFALALPLVALAQGNGAGTLEIYFADLGRPLGRLLALPDIVGWLGLRAFHRLKFGLTFGLLALALLARRRERWPESVWIVLLGLASLTAPFLLSPEPDLEHHVKSSMNRLLLHWVPAAWIAGSVLLASRSTAAPSGQLT